VNESSSEKAGMVSNLNENRSNMTLTRNSTENLPMNHVPITENNSELISENVLENIS